MEVREKVRGAVGTALAVVATPLAVPPPSNDDTMDRTEPVCGRMDALALLPLSLTSPGEVAPPAPRPPRAVCCMACMARTDPMLRRRAAEELLLPPPPPPSSPPLARDPERAVKPAKGNAEPTPAVPLRMTTPLAELGDVGRPVTLLGGLAVGVGLSEMAPVESM